MKLLRDVSPAECPWLDWTHYAGEEFEIYDDVTYGVIGNGVAVVFKGDRSFVEMPLDAVYETTPYGDYPF